LGFGQHAVLLSRDPWFVVHGANEPKERVVEAERRLSWTLAEPIRATRTRLDERVQIFAPNAHAAPHSHRRQPPGGDVAADRYFVEMAETCDIPDR
jgi:hypothetical protein